MLFRVPGLTKTRRLGGLSEALHPKFVLDARICPVNILSLYLKVSQKHCTQLDKKQPLFVAAKRPHKAVTAAIISIRLKEILSRAGVDTNIFKTHPTSLHLSSKSLRSKQSRYNEGGGLVSRVYIHPVLLQASELGSVWSYHS